MTLKAKGAPHIPMQECHYSIKKNPIILQESLVAARHYIALFYKIDVPNQEQYFTLANAHYTLALQQSLNSKRCKMHLNSSITLLQNLNSSYKDAHWYSLIANCYVKRAELYEEEGNLKTALCDYLRVFELFHPSNFSIHNPTENNFSKVAFNSWLSENSKTLLLSNNLLVAQTAICITDLLLNQYLPAKLYNQLELKTPMFYIDIALENLSKLPSHEDEILITEAYAYQMAALAKTNQNLHEALDYFHCSLKKAFSVSTEASFDVLLDIYNSLGLLYEQYSQDLVIHKHFNNHFDHAMIYFTIALFFHPMPKTSNDHRYKTDQDDYHETCSYYDGQELLNIILDSIHRALDPYPHPLSLDVMQNLIDALLFVYFCLIEGKLPNQEIASQLEEKDKLDNFAQHIFFLVSEFNRRNNSQAHLQLMIEKDEKNFLCNIKDNLYQCLNIPKKDNVIPLKKKSLSILFANEF